MTLQVTEESVEAAAKAEYDDWETLGEAEQDECRTACRRALKAALPHLEGEGALRELAEWVEAQQADAEDRQREDGWPAGTELPNEMWNVHREAAYAFKAVADRIRSMPDGSSEQVGEEKPNA